MKAVLLVIKGNLTHRKLYSLIIFAFSFFTSLLLITSVGIIQKLHSQYPESYSKASESDIVYLFDKNNFNVDAEKNLLAQKNVEETHVLNGFVGELNISEDKTQLILTEAPSYKNYSTKKVHNGSVTLVKNEILLPFSYSDTYKFKSGEEIKIFGDTYEIKGFFEDPIFGSPFYEMKRALISDEALLKLKRKDSPTEYKKLVFLEANLKPSSVNDGKRFEHVNEKFEYSQFALNYFNKNDLARFRTTAPTIILGIVVLFSLFLLIIMIFVIRYILTSIIEQEQKNMGILKAIGFNGTQLLSINVIHYLSLSLLGIFSGTIGSYLISPIIGSYMLNVSGILWIGNISWAIPIIINFLLLLFIFFIMLTSIWKVFSIRPVDAIIEKNMSNSRLNFKPSFFKFPLTMFGIGEKISFNQLLFSLGQHLSLLILLALFSFSIMNLVGISKSFTTVENVSHMLGYDVNDIRLDVINSENDDTETILAKINNDYELTYRSSFDNSHRVQLEKDEKEIQLLVYSNFPESNVTKGRVPKKDNEVIISGGIEDDYSKTIGDKLKVKTKDGLSKQYNIVGIYNQVYDMGKNIGLTEDGARSLLSTFSPSQYLLKVESSENIDSVIDHIENTHKALLDGINLSNERKFVLTRIQTIQNVLYVISILVIVISLVLITLITYLLSLVLINREFFNFGVMKSIGFTSFQLRVQFVLRFFILGVMGVFFGMIFYWISDNALINTIFSMIHIAQIPSDKSLSLIVFNILYILVLVVGNTWIVSRKIRKVNVSVLISQG
ncbi:hypothetical protein IGI46_002866 [Enterococcus sp. AZ163]